MDTCYNCGGLIEFRTVDGVVTPIHITGGCWQNSNNPSELGGFQPLRRSSLRYESYVNPNAHCPVCGEQVFFYQSEYGGRVFFDELGPPWPKHPCTYNPVVRHHFSSAESRARFLISPASQEAKPDSETADEHQLPEANL